MKNKSIFNDFLKYVSLNILGQAAFSCYTLADTFFVFDMTNTYLKVMLLFAPAFLFNHLLQCFVRNDGAPSRSMAAMIAGSLSNVVLNYIFIFPLHMGIFGAIFATGLAPVISMAVLSSYFIRKKNRFRFVKALPKARRMFEILSSICF